MTELNKKAFGGLLALVVVMGALLFIPAWTLDYWQGVGLSHRIFRAGARHHRVPHEEGPEALAATGVCGSNRREGAEPKDHTIRHIDGIYRDACRPRA